MHDEHHLKVFAVPTRTHGSGIIGIKDLFVFLDYDLRVIAKDDNSAAGFAYEFRSGEIV
jgi:hypothetical protein